MRDSHQDFFRRNVHRLVFLLKTSRSTKLNHRPYIRPSDANDAESPQDAQRVVSQQSNWRESVLHGSQVCIRQREPFLTPNRGKVELIGWGRGRQSSCQTRSHTWVGQRLGPRPMMLFMALFMTLS